MTRVCLVGDDEVNLRYELLSRETAREALSTYELHEPYENTMAIETVSLGAAISLLNDLNWYLVRYADDVLVREPSIDDEEWLSRSLATAVRDDELEPAETARLLKVYGVEDRELVSPRFLDREGIQSDPEDLHDAEQTVVVRVTREEFEN